MVSEAINKYITTEKVDILGNPMPKDGDGFEEIF